ncbi:hypothetical protein MYSTI_06126 [Myxococcus stipitatus DSM 14675]|uniref:Glycine zipper domain-containing protein n=1 Tax=Myxococcus stipitatus (strain DSM 14675 / JCM 12634 / Mx s8) TaxID=1278073 RepID=L7ULP2_MYXSD|nr:hypothetical protein [Myxococcus stipitatus]AGC47399.1 hypothetical protein MYSTI_06126 [Myxococcus stipitatus DSM 14675]
MNSLKHLSTWNRFVALGCVLALPGAGLASEAPPPLEPLPRLDAPPGESGGRKVGRVAAEAGMMWATAMGTGFAGLLIAASQPDDELSPPKLQKYADWQRGFLLGAAVGAPFGVMLGGKIAKGKGAPEGVLLGALAGGGVAVLTAQLRPEKKVEDTLFLLVPAFSMLGSLIGYELSHTSNLPSRSSDSTVSILPAVSVDTKGSALGLTGQF